MKVTVCRNIEGLLFRDYELTDDDLKEFIKTCEQFGDKIDDAGALISFLEDNIECCDEDIDIDHMFIDSCEGFEEVFEKCNKLAYGFNNSETKISGDNSEAE